MAAGVGGAGGGGAWKKRAAKEGDLRVVCL
jgi:hypothetical protein